MKFRAFFSIPRIVIQIFRLSFRMPVSPMAIQANSARMIAAVKYLSQDCFPRSEKEQYEKAALLIEEHFTKSGLDVARQEYRGMYNVIGFKKGKTNRRIIIGAHYDSVEVTPGADDNASGLAVLIELAYLLQQTPQPDCDVELVAWNSEEPPLW